MKKTMTFACLAVFFTSFILGTSLVYAKKPGGMPGGFEKGEKKGWGESKTPPGWSKGEKKGWNDEGVPPGLKTEEETEE